MCEVEFISHLLNGQHVMGLIYAAVWETLQNKPEKMQISLGDWQTGSQDLSFPLLLITILEELLTLLLALISRSVKWG